MAIYEYQCRACGKDLEVMQKMTEEPLKKCPDCGGRLRKKISNTSFVLKGTGWYATDYASKRGTAGSGEKVQKNAAPEAGKKDETKVETKSEAKGAAVSG